MNGFSLFTFLLIVPYGIETAVAESARIAHILLIVPYGIETSKRTSSETADEFF